MPALPSPRRLLIFAVLLPGIVAATNQILIETLPGHWLRTCLYPAMAVSTAVISWCAGRYLQPAWLSWIVFAWSLALLDLLSIAVCLSGPIGDHFGYMMVTSQMCLVVVWTILGASSWQWRITVVLLATPALIMFADVFMRSSYGRWRAPHWVIVMLIATVVIAILCGSLRAAGFSLRMSSNSSIDARASPPDRIFQFGLRHMLVWSAALVPLLLVGRGIDLLMFGRINTQGIFPVILVAASLAIINLTAIWAVLGNGPPLARIASLILVPAVFAYALHRLTLYFESINGGWPAFSMLWVLYEVKDEWTSWLMMDALLLAALLLFLRSKGYCLMRRLA